MQEQRSKIDIATMEKTAEHVAANPEDGKGTFETVTTWREGAVSLTKARSFELQADEPQPLGGTDTAIDPMELLLASLGTCLTIGWITRANKRGIEVRDLKVTVRAPYDLRGYLGLSKNVRPGFSGLEYEVDIDTDADPAVLEEIRAETEKGSPMFDNIANATPTAGRVKVTA